MWLPKKPSKLRLREAENARRNRLEIVKARSIGQISRRDLLKWGLFTAGGALAWKHGLNPFVRSAYATTNIPTGLPPSPLFGVQPFAPPTFLVACVLLVGTGLAAAAWAARSAVLRQPVAALNGE